MATFCRQLSNDVVTRKCGPREIGRMKGWKPANYGIDVKIKKGKNTDFLQERVSKTNKKNTASGESSESSDYIYKPGPRDIGRNRGWKPADYGIKLKHCASAGDFLKERTSFSAPKKLQRSQSVYKPGPRDIGRLKGWKAADYGIDLKAKDPNFLKERVGNKVPKKKSKEEKVYKPGPRDIGRQRGWKPAKYDGVDLKVKGDFLKPKVQRATTQPELSIKKRRASKATKRYSSFSSFNKPILTRKSSQHNKVVDELKENNTKLKKENDELKAQIIQIKENSKNTETKLRLEIESLQKKIKIYEENTPVEKVGSLNYNLCTE